MEKSKKEIVAQGRGNYKRYSDDSFEFSPQGKGEPTYEEVKKHKNGVTVATSRGKSPKKYVRIPIEADAADPFYACVEKLGEAFPDTSDDKTVVCRGCVLLRGKDLQLVLNKTRGLIQFEGQIDLRETPKYDAQLFNLFNEMNQCLAINKTSIRSAIPVQQKSSSN